MLNLLQKQNLILIIAECKLNTLDKLIKSGKADDKAIEDRAKIVKTIKKLTGNATIL